MGFDSASVLHPGRWRSALQNYAGIIQRQTITSCCQGELRVSGPQHCDTLWCHFHTAFQARSWRGSEVFLANSSDYSKTLSL